MTVPTPPWVMLVTDRRRLSPEARTTSAELAALNRWLDRAIAAGVDFIQLRERDLRAIDQARLARGVVDRSEGTSTRVLVNDRADVAWSAGAHGTHLPAEGLPSHVVRSLDQHWIIGRSMHAGDDLTAAVGNDYVLFGTMFPTASKPGVAGCGVPALRRAAASTAVPVIAIGGMTPATAGEAVSAGAAGVAAVSLFFDEDRAGGLGVERAVAELRESMTRR